jgi:lysophospholipase L1-like esterase
MKGFALLPLFILTSTLLTAGLNRNQILRGNLQNSLYKFEVEKKGTVAFIGGSITQMEGYRPIIAEWLENRFPETKFTFINAGISSTCSTTGAFRLRSHVLEKDVDLLLVEFAVNDDQDANHSLLNAVRGMEGIIRQARTYSPDLDIIGTHFVNLGMLELIQKGETPISVLAHNKVHEHYNIPTNYVARELADQIQAGTFTWQQYGGVHPKKPGNTLAAEGAIALMKEAWSNKTASKPVAHQIPEKVLDNGSYFHGHFLPDCSVSLEGGFVHHVPDWKSIKGGFRNTFAGMKLFCGETAGNSAKIQFKGNTLAAYVLAGPDAGIVEVEVDGIYKGKVDLLHHYSRGLHYPRTVILAANLCEGEHTAVIKVSEEKNDASKGNAVRVLHFGVNNP